MSATGDRRQSATSRTDWETPDDVFGALDREFHFRLDAAASAENRKCNRYLSEIDDALDDAWNWAELAGHRAIWLNPPYGPGLLRWVERCVQEANRDATVVALLPNSTDCRWFHECLRTADEIRFVQGRINFIGSPSVNTAGSVIVVWRPYPKLRSVGPRVSSWTWKGQA